MKSRLTCQHDDIYRSAELQANMRCKQCGKLSKLIAVETREWHVRCQANKCTYSRFAGSSEANANLMANRHTRSTGHADISVDYMREPHKVRIIKNLFGEHQRRVKTIISDTSQSIPFDPEMLKITSAAIQGELPDEPPF